jgi:hypothetical protein
MTTDDTAPTERDYEDAAEMAGAAMAIAHQAEIAIEWTREMELNTAPHPQPEPEEEELAADRWHDCCNNLPHQY